MNFYFSCVRANAMDNKRRVLATPNKVLGATPFLANGKIVPVKREYKAKAKVITAITKTGPANFFIFSPSILAQN